MNRKRSQLQAYFAGLFDGEGCIGMNGSDKNGLSVVIGMTDPWGIFLIHREYPESNVYLRPNKENGWRPCYIIRFNNHKAYNFLRDIEPFSIVKRDQVKVALAYLAHRRREHYFGRVFNGKGCVGVDCGGRCDRLLTLLSNLKRVTYKGVNSVNLGELREYRAKPEDVEADKEFLLTCLHSLWEGVETSGEASTANKPVSAPEKDIVQVLGEMGEDSSGISG